MSLALWVYLIDTLSVGKGFTVTLVCIGALLVLAFMINLSFPNDKGCTETLYCLRKAEKIFVALVIYATIVPTRETAYLMLAAYGLEEIVTSEKVRELGGKSFELIEYELGKYLEEKVNEQQD